MASKSPAQRSLEWLRTYGYLAQVVEKWNPFARVRQDLFGIIDIIAVSKGEVYGIQTTTGDHLANRVDKMLASPDFDELAAAMRLYAHGWRKVKPRGAKRATWEVRIVDVNQRASLRTG